MVLVLTNLPALLPKPKMAKPKPMIDMSDTESDLNLALSESESDDEFMIVDDDQYDEYDVNDNMKMSQARQNAESQIGRRVGGRNGAGTNQASSPQHSQPQSGSQKVGKVITNLVFSFDCDCDHQVFIIRQAWTRAC